MEDSALSNTSEVKDAVSGEVRGASASSNSAQSSDQTQRTCVSSSDMMRFRTFSPLVPLAPKTRSKTLEHQIPRSDADWKGVQPVTASVTDSTLHDRVSSWKSVVSRSDWTIGTFSVSNVENSGGAHFHAQLPASQRRKFTIPHAREESTTTELETPSSFPDNGSAPALDEFYRVSNYMSSMTDWGTVRLNPTDPLQILSRQGPHSQSSSSIESNSQSATIANLQQTGITATGLFAGEVEKRQGIDKKYFRGLLGIVRTVFASDALQDLRLRLEEMTVCSYAVQLRIQEQYWRQCIAASEHEGFKQIDHDFDIVNSIVGIAGGPMRRILRKWIWRRRQKKKVFLMRVKRIMDAQHASRCQLLEEEAGECCTLMADMIAVQENDFRCALMRVVLTAHVTYARIEVTWAEHLEWYDMLFLPPRSTHMPAIPHSLDEESNPSSSSSSDESSDIVSSDQSDSVRDSGRAVPLAFRLVFLEEAHGRENTKAEHHATYPAPELDGIATA